MLLVQEPAGEPRVVAVADRTVPAIPVKGVSPRNVCEPRDRGEGRRHSVGHIGNPGATLPSTGGVVEGPV